MISEGFAVIALGLYIGKTVHISNLEEMYLFAIQSRPTYEYTKTKYGRLTENK